MKPAIGCKLYNPSACYFLLSLFATIGLLTLLHEVSFKKGVIDADSNGFCPSNSV